MADTGGNPWTTRTPFADPRIGAEFAARRAARGWTGELVAQLLKWSPSKVSRVEGARTSITLRALDQLIALYDMGEPAATSLRALHATSAARRRFAVTHATASGTDETDLLAGGDLAASVREWAPQYVPRLLQTPAYAQAIANSRQRVIPTSPAMIRAQVAAAARWQARLTADPPCQLRAVLDESVLYRAVGDRHLMATQLEHLAAPGAGAEVRVLPFTCYAPTVPGPFTCLSYPEMPGLTGCPDLVLLENLDGLYRPDLSENEVWKRALMFGSLWELADPPAGAISRAQAAAA